ncbi:ANTAR domain-containing protein [Streptomyces violascens]|uniref:ANTAR domain-containing protein n=1 Tax=Streptomyces violascens TaxID=67381 RepID=UPI0037AADDE1
MSEQMTITAQLQVALDSRIVVEQAKGYLSHHRGRGVEEAFSVLRGYARAHQSKLTEVARSVLKGDGDPALLDPGG